MVGPRIIICGSSQDTDSINRLNSELIREGRYEVQLFVGYSHPPNLASCQWVIVVRPTSVSKADPVVGSFVDAALNLAAQRRIQGVLAVTESSYYVADNIIPDRWLTLRTYKALDNERDLDKLKRTLSYTKMPPPRSQTSSQPNSGPPLRSPMQQDGTPPQNPGMPSQHRRPPLMAIILVCAVVLVLVSGSLWVYSLISHSPSSSAKPHATATALVRLTATASSNTATATAQVTPTPSPEQLFTATTKKTPTFTDKTPDRPGDKNSWTSDNGTGCFFSATDNAYLATVQGPSGAITPCMLTGKNFTDFVYQVDMSIFSGDAGGIIFRSDTKVATYYRFSVGLSLNGSTMVYRLNVCNSCNNTNGNGVKELTSGPTTIQPPSNNTPQVYKLAVMVSQSTIYLFVNGTQVDQVTDTTASSGEIGVYAGSLGNQTEVAFSNVKVWKL